MHELTAGHTIKRYDGELAHLHLLVLEMGGLVLSQLNDALTAFKTQNTCLAQHIVSRDAAVDNLEVKADQEIIHIIARRCPVASDLRVVITVSKSVSDLEKIGDEAVRIAGLLDDLVGRDKMSLDPRITREIDRIGALAIGNFQSALELFDVWDEAKALRVVDGHRQMNNEFQAELQRLMSYIMEETLEIGRAVRLVLVVKSLDRIAHHAQNLAEYVLFEMNGVDLRGRPGPA